MRVAVLFLRLGPYHIARLEAAGKHVASMGGELTGIEVARTSRAYAWDPVAGGDHFRKRTLFDGRAYEDITKRETRAAVQAILSELCPDVVVLPGWSAPESLVALGWALRHGVPTVMMSESARADAPRHGWSEAPKRRIVRCCAAALVGGRRHVDYLVDLGMPREHIFLGYDTIDNDYFRLGADAARKQAGELRQKYRLPNRYFLTSNRFVPKKNLARLLSAFARYRAQAGSAAWDLVLCGDGPLRSALEAQVDGLGLKESVHFAGFTQYGDLPAYYGLASAFIHVSTVEQWGLVVNEAAAAGLPVLVSDRCGSVSELVIEGKNGVVLDPLDEEAMARAMHNLSQDPSRALEMGRASRDIVDAFSPQRFASGLVAAAECALQGPKTAPSAVSRWVVHLMTMR